jgi:sirohydrochlorin ferrochelatase
VILDILKNLFELAAGNSPVVVIITLATTADAYGRETDELSALMDDLQVKTEATALGEAHSVLSRTGSVVQPAEDAEIAEILKRRLFAGINTEAAAEAGQAYGSLYERLASQGSCCPAARTTL